MWKHANCLWYALDKWHAEGGYMVLGRSKHWLIPHVLHLSIHHELTHFSPVTDLRMPWLSLFGFDGSVIAGDTQRRGPMSKHGMFVGSLVLMVFGAVWAAQNTGKRIFRRFSMTDIDAQIKVVEDALQDRRASVRRKADRRMTAGTTQQDTDQTDIKTAFDADRLPNTRGFEPT